MKIKNLLACMLLPAALSVNAQEIRIGQKVPDVPLVHLLKYKKTSAKLLSEFGGKPIILDFWFQACGVCIKIMPKMDSIQAENEGRLTILSSTHEPAKEIIPFVNRIHNLNTSRIVMSIGDSALHSLFPYIGAPHYVWIDKNGTVVAITGATEVTRENVRKLVNGETLHLPNKNERTSKDYSIPFASYFDYDSSASVCFIKKGYVPEMGAMHIREHNVFPGRQRIAAINEGIADLYKWAYATYGGGDYGFHDSQIITIGLPDSFLVINENTIPKQGVYTYDRIMYANSKKELSDVMVHDLDQFFRINSRVEKRFIKCYVLSRTSTDKPNYISTETGTTRGDWYKDKVKGLYVVKYQTFQNIEQGINMGNLELNFRLINETGLKNERVDIEIPLDFSDLDKVNQHLAKYQLAITLELRLLDAIVLRRADVN